MIWRAPAACRCNSPARWRCRAQRAGISLALRYLPLTVTGAIAFTVPLLICALSVPFLGESVGWRRWTSIAVGFVGISIIVRPGTDAFHPASLLSLAAALCTAF